MTKEKKFYIVLICILLIGVISQYIRNRGEKNMVPTTQENSTSTKKIVDVRPGLQAEVEEESIAPNKQVPQPDLNRPITFPSSYSEKAAKKVGDDMKVLVASLKAKPYSYETWNDLAIFRKMIEDYKGAEEIWVFLTTVAPTKPDAYLNLGELYMYYFHQNAKAEQAFLRVIEVSPHWFEGYKRLVDFYVIAAKEPAKAKKILKESIARFPDMKAQLEPLLKSLS